MPKKELNRYQFDGKRLIGNDFSSLPPAKNNENRPERKRTFFILLATLLATGIFWLKTEIKNHSGIFFKPYSFELVLGQTRQEAKNEGELLEKIKALVQNLNGQYAVYVYALDRQQGYGFNQNELFPAASINKVPIMLAYYHEVEKGVIEEDSQYQLQSQDIQDYGTGSLRYQEAGKKFSYGELVSLMGKQSDNTATYVISNILGMEEMQKFINDLGFSQTSLEKNETTAEELGRIFVLLYQGKILKTEKARSQFFTNLKDTDFEDRLPAGLPAGTAIAHKIGSGERVYHDCGLVFDRNPFVLCVLSQEAAEDEALDVIPKIAKVVWEFEEKSN